MLLLYNSLSKTIEKFAPTQSTKVTLYVCGITPYDTTHLGHAFTYISFDTLVRYLNFQGLHVNYTQNVTDINDRDNDMLKRAQEQQTTWQELSIFWTKKFLTDMATLDWIAPTNYLYASEQIPSMVSLIERIVANGFGYVLNDSVYLDVQKIPDFGKLSNLTQEQMMVRAKEFEEDLGNPDKKHPLDVTLWRGRANDKGLMIKDKLEEPAFSSPWGNGRPGWHVECSAMAVASLGEQIDIHGGGLDLIYPHHESEIVQSEAATNKKPFAKHWMHTGIVGINGQKMSKSLKNLILVSDLLKKYSANAIRWVLLSHHYRSNWEYKEEEFAQAEKTLCVISNLVTRLPARQGNPNEISRKARDDSEYKKQALMALDNDLDTPTVLSLSQQAVVTEPKSVLEILVMLGFTI